MPNALLGEGLEATAALYIRHFQHIVDADVAELRHKQEIHHALVDRAAWVQEIGRFLP